MKLLKQILQLIIIGLAFGLILWVASYSPSARAYSEQSCLITTGTTNCQPLAERTQYEVSTK